MCGDPYEYVHREYDGFFLRYNGPGHVVFYGLHGDDESCDDVYELQKHYGSHEQTLSYEYRRPQHASPYVSQYRLYEDGIRSDNAYSVIGLEINEVRCLV
jgi:hypothetical protein